MNIGSGPVNVTNAYIVIKDREYPLKFRRVGNLKPSDINEIIGKVKVNDLSETNLLTVVVEYALLENAQNPLLNTRLDAIAYVINKDMFGGSTIVTVTQTVTITIHATTTSTTTATITTTTTITITKPA